MRWPWRHRDDGGHERADRAVAQARERRREQQARDEGFLPLADRIRRMRERNHLAEAVEQALREGRR
jgi:hypothetical protein